MLISSIGPIEKLFSGEEEPAAVKGQSAGQGLTGKAGSDLARRIFSNLRRNRRKK